MIVRYFAGAAEAAGTPERHVEAPPEGSVTDLVSELSRGNERLAAVLNCSALLADGVRVADRDAPLGQVAQLDVLPPFAGG